MIMRLESVAIVMGCCVRTTLVAELGHKYLSGLPLSFVLWEGYVQECVRVCVWGVQFKHIHMGSHLFGQIAQTCCHLGGWGDTFFCVPALGVYSHPQHELHPHSALGQ